MLAKQAVENAVTSVAADRANQELVRLPMGTPAEIVAGIKKDLKF